MENLMSVEITKDLLNSIKKAYLEFELDGYINDENTSLGSTSFENSDFLNQQFSKLGYDGEQFICHAHFYPGYGAVYWIYDTRVMSYEESKKRTNMFVEMNNA